MPSKSRVHPRERPPLAQRFSEMIRESGGVDAMVDGLPPQPNPLDGVLEATAREKKRAALDRAATAGSYSEQKEARAALDAMARADERTVYEQAKTALRSMSSAQLDAIDTSTLTAGDRKALREEERRRTNAAKQRVAKLQDELDEAEGVVTLDDDDEYGEEAAAEDEAVLELADAWYLADDDEDAGDRDATADEAGYRPPWWPPLGLDDEAGEGWAA
jgi:hypothetical protein